MNDLERDFEEIVKKNRGTIYTVCYMFSIDIFEIKCIHSEIVLIFMILGRHEQ